MQIIHFCCLGCITLSLHRRYSRTNELLKVFIQMRVQKHDSSDTVQHTWARGTSHNRRAYGNHVEAAMTIFFSTKRMCSTDCIWRAATQGGKHQQPTVKLAGCACCTRALQLSNAQTKQPWDLRQYALSKKAFSSSFARRIKDQNTLQVLIRISSNSFWTKFLYLISN